MSTKDDGEIGAMQTCLAALTGLDQEEQIRVLTWLSEKLKLKVAPDRGAALPGAPPNVPRDGQPFQPKAFLAAKKPKSDVERITCLAFFLTHQRDTPQFKTNDLTNLNAEAALPKLSNPSVAVENAGKAQYLTQAGAGKKQITARGEVLVNALPDRDSVKAALDDSPLARRHKRRGKGLAKPGK